MVSYCQKCGARIEKDDIFCPDCGANIAHTAEKGGYSPAVAAVLGLLFGPLGYIYVRRYWRILLGYAVALIFIVITKGKGIILIPIVFALDCYRIAKKSQRP